MLLVLSEYWVLSSQIVRPCAPCAARCIEQADKKWLAFAIQCKSKTPFEGGRLKVVNTSPCAIKLELSCLGKTHFNEPSTSPGNEVMPMCSRFTLCSIFDLYLAQHGFFVGSGLISARPGSY